MNKRVRIVFNSGPIQEYTNNLDSEYHTQVGMAGELILYRRTLHRMLSAKLDPVIWKVWAAGRWEYMEHDEVADEDAV